VAELLVETPEGLVLRHTVVNAGSRFAAALVDGLLLGLVLLFVALALAAVFAVDPTGASGFVLGLLIGGSVGVVALYQVVVALATDGRSLGKWLLGIRVVGGDGATASALQHVLRGLLFPLDAFLMVPLPLGILLIAATERHQRLGDQAAGTIVVRERGRPVAPDPYPRDRWETLSARRLVLTPVLAQRFGEDDFEYLRALLSRTGLEAGARRRLLATSARHYGAVLGLDVPAAEAETVLREIYLFLRDLR
jgi:uncharacterized RDD family membrane protein YckC